MSYPDPATTDWVPLWSAGPIAGYVPAARVYHSTGQSINSATETSLAFDSERLDTDGIHDTVTNNGRLTCKTAGLYLISANLAWIANPVTSYALFRLNGVTPIAITYAFVDYRYMNLSTIYYLQPGDYVELRVNQTSGAAVQVASSANNSPEFSMVYLGPNVALGAVMPVAYGTTLPAAPVDGQEAILVDSITNPSYQWRFRYNAGSSSAYKWEFIGGSSIGGNASPAFNTFTSGSTSYVDLTGGPTATLPRAGDYRVHWGGRSQNNGTITAAHDCHYGLNVAGTVVARGDMTHAQIAYVGGFVWRRDALLGVAAGSVVKLQVFGDNADVARYDAASIEITPIRVS